MSSNYVTTRLYEAANAVAETYAAWVKLNENRRISKEQAVNELVVKGATGTLPPEIMRQMGIKPEKNGKK